MTDHTLGEFEAWCKGEGRGGDGAGWHWNSLKQIRSFHKFKETQRRKRIALEKKAKTVESD